MLRLKGQDYHTQEDLDLQVVMLRESTGRCDIRGDGPYGDMVSGNLHWAAGSTEWFSYDGLNPWDEGYEPSIVNVSIYWRSE